MPHATALDILQDRNSFPHHVDSIEVVETHISFVVLTGDFAYKIKKPVDLGFLDFSTLKKRKYYCEQELKLNRRSAPDIYLDVVTVTPGGVMPIDHPPAGDSDDILEYAVRMRQFDRSGEFDRLLTDNKLDSNTVRRLAGIVAEFHKKAPVCDRGSGYATPDVIREQVEENFDHILDCLPAGEVTTTVSVLKQWVAGFFRNSAGYLDKRLDSGFIRECHGDLHLANIALIDGVPTPFDCIEFSPAYRCIDLMSEIAFTTMDLDYHQRRDLARVFLDNWLRQTGDYYGLRLLRYYKVYRATVRAKVFALRCREQRPGDAGNDCLAAYGYLELASGYTREAHRGPIIITHGLSACGKTHVTSLLLEIVPAIRVRSDIERKRLFGLATTAHRQNGVKEGIYSTDADDQTYDQLADLAQNIVEAGYPAILDATWLHHRHRQAIYKLGEKLGVPVVILHVTAPEPVLRSRITKRSTTGKDASDATGEVLDHQLKTIEALDEHEQSITVNIDTSLDWNPQALKQRLEERAGITQGSPDGNSPV